MFLKWVLIYIRTWSVYALEPKGSGPNDYSKCWEVSEVRELLSDGNRGGPVTILFVLRAWDWSLVFDTMRASMGPQCSTSHKSAGFSVSPRYFFICCKPFCCSFVIHMIHLDMYEKADCGWYWLTPRDLNNNFLDEYISIVKSFYFWIF